jgi:hypothetical protein
VEVVTLPSTRTLVSFRPPPIRRSLVAKLADGGVIVRSCRDAISCASCGWWTSDDDLQRLVDGPDQNQQQPDSAAIG